MRAGKIDRHLTLQRVTNRIPNGFNEPVEVWTDIAILEAQQRPDRGTERFAAQQLSGQAVMTFQIRYRADLTIEDRIVYGGRIWNIVDVRELGRCAVTEFVAVARAEA